MTYKESWLIELGIPREKADGQPMNLLFNIYCPKKARMEEQPPLYRASTPGSVPNLEPILDPEPTD